MNRRKEKLESEISKIVGNTIREIYSLASVIKTELTNKFTNAYVFVSIYGDREFKTFKNLKSKEPFIRKELANKLKSRYVPNIILVKDDTMEYSSKIDSLLKTLNKDD